MPLKKCKECGNDVSSKAKSCPNCGSIANKNVNCLTGIIIIFVSLLVVGFVMTSIVGNDSQSPKKQSDSSRSIDSSKSTGITMAKYKNIKSGMTYQEVVKIIGESGEENSRVEIPGTPVTILYSWKQKGFMAMGNMNATFQGNKLVTKAQFELK